MAAGAGKPDHNPSANKPGSEDDEYDACTPQFWWLPWRLDFCEELEDLHEGPWGLPMHWGSSLEGDSYSPSGRAWHRDRANLATYLKTSDRIKVSIVICCRGGAEKESGRKSQSTLIMRGSDTVAGMKALAPDIENFS